MNRDPESLVIASALTGITGALVIASLQLSPTAAAVPLAVAVPTLLLFAGQLIADARDRSARSGAGVTHDPRRTGLPRREISAVWWMAFLLALMWAAGLLAALPLYLLVHLRMRARESWSTSLFVAVAAWWLLFAGLGVLLHVQWRPGAVWTWMTGL